MGIYIEGVEMPETCKLCYLSEFSAGLYAYVCKPTGVRIDYEMAKVSKPKRICPLIEVPEPHGRLGDLDALHSALRKRGKEFSDSEYGEGVKCGLADAREFIKNAPTVIPVSESKERPAFLPQYELTPRSEEGE